MSAQHFMRTFNEAIKDYNERTKLWVYRMKEAGCIASHPDDGWVDREENYVQLVYPHFKKEIRVGDKIALGGFREHRIVEVTAIVQCNYFINEAKPKYYFKEI